MQRPWDVILFLKCFSAAVRNMSVFPEMLQHKLPCAYTCKSRSCSQPLPCLQLNSSMNKICTWREERKCLTGRRESLWQRSIISLRTGTAAFECMDVREWNRELNAFSFIGNHTALPVILPITSSCASLDSRLSLWSGQAGNMKSVS